MYEGWRGTLCRTMALVDEDWSVVQRPARYVSVLCTHVVDNDVDDVLGQAIEWVLGQLTPQECFIAQARYYENVTIRELAGRLGLAKSHTHRLCVRTEVRLRTICIEHPLIQARLGLAS